MFALLIGTIVLSLLYGFFWHDQSARQEERVQPSDKEGQR
jgi:hypothetical protein